MHPPTLFAIILGKHGYAMSPELETAWCRFFLFAGVMFGFFIGKFIA